MKKYVILRCSFADVGATDVWKRSARKVALAPAVGPCSKSTAWPTMRIADGGFPDASAVSLTTTVYWTSSSSSVSWWMEKLA